MLINIETTIPSIVRDIRYATVDNFLGVAVYSHPCCFVHAYTAEALAAAQQEFLARGCSLKIFDGYRPLSVQQYMWDIIRDERYVSNPATNKGRHTRGTAVDVTLVDLETGREFAMPSEFDEFSERAHSTYMEASEEALTNRAVLKEIMERHGFIQHPFEWWHFDLAGWNDDAVYPPLDIPLASLIDTE